MTVVSAHAGTKWLAVRDAASTWVWTWTLHPVFIVEIVLMPAQLELSWWRSRTLNYLKNSYLNRATSKGYSHFSNGDFCINRQAFHVRLNPAIIRLQPLLKFCLKTVKHQLIGEQLLRMVQAFHLVAGEKLAQYQRKFSICLLFPMPWSFWVRIKDLASHNRRPVFT